MTIKIKKFTDIANIVFIVYAFYYGLINEFHIYFRVLIWVAVVTMLLFSQGFKIRSQKTVFLLVIVSTCFVLFQNHELSHGSFMMTLRWLFCLVYAVLSINSQQSFDKMCNYIVDIGFLNVIAVYVFWFFPGLYAGMYDVWGYWPTGTSSGLYGYRAALTNHYSQNGIVCIVVTIALFSILESRIKKREAKPGTWFLFFLSLFAVVLTTKRAHLLFGVCAMLAVYYFCNPKEMRKKTFKILTGGIFACGMVYIASYYVPEIRNAFERFTTIGTDVESLSRLEFWRLAIQLFMESPVIGIGWFGFRYQYNSQIYVNSNRADRYAYLNCHNVYIQILCETGIIGLVVYLAIVIGLVYLTFKLLKSSYDSSSVDMYRKPLILSATIQVFYLLYSMTGNCLYDITFCYYCIAVAIALGCNAVYKKRKNIMRKNV